MSGSKPWSPPPAPLTWTFDPPLTLGTASYATATLRAPTAGDVLKATAVPGEGSIAVTLRLIAAVSAEQVPFEALLAAPAWQVEQMSAYFDSFAGAPMPQALISGPLALAGASVVGS